MSVNYGRELCGPPPPPPVAVAGCWARAFIGVEVTRKITILVDHLYQTAEIEVFLLLESRPKIR